MSSNKIWVLQVDPAVYKILKKFPRKEAERIIAAIELLPLDPFTGDVEKMKGGEQVWRRRVGSYRIFYELLLQEKTIHVFHAERRTSKTY
jgi:mRNA-degrading endonuclease RelE of RelBE toxin-antitoxin system